MKTIFNWFNAVITIVGFLLTVWLTVGIISKGANNAESQYDYSQY